MEIVYPSAMKHTLFSLCLCTLLAACQSAVPLPPALPLSIENEGWVLQGDWRVPVHAKAPYPVALLLHGAIGDRSEYDALAKALAERGVASLALDLRGHGESTNLGRFEEPYAENRHLHQAAYKDIISVLTVLRARQDVDTSRLAIVAASYSGEQVGLAMRNEAVPVQAYAILSPGNFSKESMNIVNSSGSEWLFIRSSEESPGSIEYVDEVFNMLAAHSVHADIRVLDGPGHALEILRFHPGVIPEIAAWITEKIGQ